MEKTATKARALFQILPVEKPSDGDWVTTFGEGKTLDNICVNVKMNDCGDVSVCYPETIDKEVVIDVLLLGIIQLRQENPTKVE